MAFKSITKIGLALLFFPKCTLADNPLVDQHPESYCLLKKGLNPKEENVQRITDIINKDISSFSGSVIYLLDENSKKKIITKLAIKAENEEELIHKVEEIFVKVSPELTKIIMNSPYYDQPGHREVLKGFGSWTGFLMECLKQGKINLDGKFTITANQLKDFGIESSPKEIPIRLALPPKMQKVPALGGSMPPEKERGVVVPVPEVGKSGHGPYQGAAKIEENLKNIFKDVILSAICPEDEIKKNENIKSFIHSALSYMTMADLLMMIKYKENFHEVLAYQKGGHGVKPQGWYWAYETRRQHPEAEKLVEKFGRFHLPPFPKTKFVDDYSKFVATELPKLAKDLGGWVKYVTENGESRYFFKKGLDFFGLKDKYQKVSNDLQTKIRIKHNVTDPKNIPKSYKPLTVTALEKEEDDRITDKKMEADSQLRQEQYSPPAYQTSYELPTESTPGPGPYAPLKEDHNLPEYIVTKIIEEMSEETSDTEEALDEKLQPSIEKLNERQPIKLPDDSTTTKFVKKLKKEGICLFSKQLADKTEEAAANPDKVGNLGIRNMTVLFRNKSQMPDAAKKVLEDITNRKIGILAALKVSFARIMASICKLPILGNFIDYMIRYREMPKEEVVPLNISNLEVKNAT